MINYTRITRKIRNLEKSLSVDKVEAFIIDCYTQRIALYPWKKRLQSLFDKVDINLPVKYFKSLDKVVDGWKD